MPRMGTWSVLAIAFGIAMPSVASNPREWVAPGPNLALNKPYTLTQAGKLLPYALTADEGDKTQLTDGRLAPTRFIWHSKASFGRFTGTTGIAIDLGEIRSIGGVGYSSDGAFNAGVGYPPAILILVSDNGQDYRAVGELVGLASKFGPPPWAGRHWFRTNDLKTHGRYVQLVVQSGLFVFTDEVEVYEGKPDYLKKEVSGPVVTDPVVYLSTNIMPYAVSARITTDAARAVQQVESLPVSNKVRKRVCSKLETLRQAALIPEMIAYDQDFRSTAPLNPLHAAIFAAVAPAFRAAGYPEYMTWTRNRWLRQTPFMLPATPSNGVIESVSLNVRMVQNDRRGEVINIANFGPTAKSAVVSVAGLPGGAKPSYLDVRQVEYVAMSSRPWDADALPSAEPVEGGWKVSLPAGLSRQLWLDFRTKPDTCPAGSYAGEWIVKVEDGPELRVPLALTVDDLVLPDRKAVTVGVWDYTHGGRRGEPESRSIKGYALNEGNTDAAIAHMRESGVDAPWAHIQWSDNDVFPCWGKTIVFDTTNNLVTPPNYDVFDRWVKSRPEAKYYAILGGVSDNWQGTTMGSDAFKQRLTAVMKHWAAHMREIGIDPAKIVICLIDEPQTASAARLMLGWGEVIRAAVPEFKFFVDSLYKPGSFADPTVLKMFDLMDIIVPGTSYAYQNFGQAAVDFYGKLCDKGKIMGFYVCAQNASEAEAISYYRLQQWWCWKINKGGRESWTGFWSYSDTRNNQPWNQLPGGHDRNWSPVYIDSRSVVDGKHWLAIFEGVNDYEYLLALKDRLEKAKQAGRQDEPVAAAQKLLDELPDEVIRGDVDACDRGRVRVLDALSALGR